MIAIAKRNIKIFFRDKMNVFFSMLVSIITLGIYVLFLGDNLSSGMDFPNAQAVMDKWIMAGILATTSLTTTLGAFGLVVRDRASKIDKDFLATPISTEKRVAGYTLGTFAVGLIMTVFTLVIAQVYIYLNGGSLFTMIEFVKILSVTVLAVLSSTAMMYLIVELFTSEMAFETAASVISSIVGFLVGVYIPLGVLPTFVQYIGIAFPVTHSASLLRQVMMRTEITTAFSGAPQEAIEGFELVMGNILQVGETIIPVWGSIVYLLLTTVLFYSAAVLLSRRKKK